MAVELKAIYRAVDPAAAEAALAAFASDALRWLVLDTQDATSGLEAPHHALAFP